VEHGDLSHPNLIRLSDGRLGVVDWELAEPRGLPLHDLLVFLAYALSATTHARTTDEHLAAFRGFFTADWPRLAVASYSAALGLERELLPALFVACWARYTAALLARLAPARDPAPELRNWLRGNRYFRYWRQAVERRLGS
jgi:aminoglycoside phosphotransferase (APT) family kinase protein